MLAFANRLMEEERPVGLLKTYLQGRLFLSLVLTAEEEERLQKILFCCGRFCTTSRLPGKR